MSHAVPVMAHESHSASDASWATQCQWWLMSHAVQVMPHEPPSASDASWAICSASDASWAMQCQWCLHIVVYGSTFTNNRCVGTVQCRTYVDINITKVKSSIQLSTTSPFCCFTHAWWNFAGPIQRYSPHIDHCPDQCEAHSGSQQLCMYNKQIKRTYM